MRDLAYLIQLFPEKTGTELLAIQEQDKIDVEKEYQEINKIKLAIIEDYNTNGAFFKGRFGTDQRYYYNVSNVRFEDKQLICDVEEIVVFLGEKGDVSEDSVTIERRIQEYQHFDTYSFEHKTRVTKKDFDKVNNYLMNIAKFWDDIKKVE